VREMKSGIRESYGGLLQSINTRSSHCSAACRHTSQPVCVLPLSARPCSKNTRTLSGALRRYLSSASVKSVLRVMQPVDARWKALEGCISGEVFGSVAISHSYLQWHMYLHTSLSLARDTKHATMGSSMCDSYNCWLIMTHLLTLCVLFRLG
jgi:hypothetical protein